MLRRAASECTVSYASGRDRLAMVGPAGFESMTILCAEGSALPDGARLVRVGTVVTLEQKQRGLSGLPFPERRPSATDHRRRVARSGSRRKYRDCGCM